jgi:gamma-glutamyl-gamma-aminobutyrate hydrolase PuuD
MTNTAKKKLLVFDQLGYANPYKSLFDVLYADTHEKLLQYLDECDVVMFTGGSDVSPHLYGETCAVYTAPNPHRDKFEMMVAKLAKERGKPMLGICRGAQFMCVFAGGKLVQDVGGHTTDHKMVDIFNNELLMTSAHHQMMIPEGTQHTLIGWAKYPQSNRYLNGERNPIAAPFAITKEPEIVYFHEIKALGIQGHPEYSLDNKLHKYACDLVERYLLGNENCVPQYPLPNPAI